MKTPLIYGLYMTLGGLVLNVILFFLNYHTDVEKFQTGQWIGGILGLILAVACIVLGTKARRDEVPVTENYGYGSALGTGVMIGVFSCLFGLVTNFLYMRVINPGYRELIIQVQAAKMAAKDIPPDKIEQMESFMRSPVGAVINAVIFVIFAMFIFTVISLITAAIFKRQATSDQPPVTV